MPHNPNTRFSFKVSSGSILSLYTNVTYFGSILYTLGQKIQRRFFSKNPAPLFYFLKLNDTQLHAKKSENFYHWFWRKYDETNRQEDKLTNGQRVFHRTFYLCVQYEEEKNSINPARLNLGRREKINLNFYFHTSLWCPKKGFDLNDHDSYFYDYSLSFHEPYFNRKDIFHESCRVNITQDYGLKTCK